MGKLILLALTMCAALVSCNNKKESSNENIITDKYQTEAKYTLTQPDGTTLPISLEMYMEYTKSPVDAAKVSKQEVQYILCVDEINVESVDKETYDKYKKGDIYKPEVKVQDKQKPTGETESIPILT